jgi:hypothetical protein
MMCESRKYVIRAKGVGKQKSRSLEKCVQNSGLIDGVIQFA